MHFKNPLDKSLPRHIRIGVWASFVSALMLIGITALWVFHPDASEVSLSIVPDSDAAFRYARLTAVFKAVGDILPPIFILLALGLHQFRLTGIYHLVTLVLVVVVDMFTWAAYVPDVQALDILQHVPFAIPMIIAAYCFLKK
ncbi:MAG: hypothetical protein NWR72_18005 [Bacteroidia bacterium]|nr:hypothetical protein [Bacteroidia bacterium]